jgi:amphi-Trp domain-containing protein
MKKTATLTRKEFAQSLRDLSSDIERGEISFDEIKEKIPANLDVKYKYKKKEGFSKFKISFRWPSEQTSDKPSAFKSSKPNKYSYKETKKQLSSSLKKLDQILSENKIPTEEQVENLMNIVEASIKSSTPKLKQGMIEVKTAIIELKQAIDNNDIMKANSTLDHLKQLRKRYHKQYK